MNYSIEKKKTKELTEKQQLFLDNVVETGGDLKKSAELAGYKGNHYQVIQSLKQELVDLAETILDRVGVTKTDKVSVDHNVSGGLFILPKKENIVLEGEYEHS